jgi:hypothetical protein
MDQDVPAEFPGHSDLELKLGKTFPAAHNDKMFSTADFSSKWSEFFLTALDMLS